MSALLSVDCQLSDQYINARLPMLVDNPNTIFDSRSVNVFYLPYAVCDIYHVPRHVSKELEASI